MLLILILSRNYLLFFLMVLFGLASIWWRKMLFTLLILLLIFSVYIYTPISKALEEAGVTTLSFVSHPKRPLRLIFTPNSGKEEVLSQPVLSVLSMMEKNNLTNFQLSTKLNIDDYINQRIIEGGYPVIYDMKSNFYFITIEELMNYKNCLILDSSETIYLVDCY